MCTVLCLPVSASLFSACFQGAGWSSAKSTGANGWPVEALTLPAGSDRDMAELLGLPSSALPAAVLMSRAPSVLDVWSDKWCAPSLPWWRPRPQPGICRSCAACSIV